MLRIINKLQLVASLTAVVFAMGVSAVIAQDGQVRKLVNGQKYKLNGVVVAKNSDSFLLRDETGVSTKVVYAPGTSIRANAFFGSGDRYAATSIVRGLRLKAIGRGDGNGALAATKVRFDKSDLRSRAVNRKSCHTD